MLELRDNLYVLFVPEDHNNDPILKCLETFDEVIYNCKDKQIIMQRSSQ